MRRVVVRRRHPGKVLSVGLYYAVLLNEGPGPFRWDRQMLLWSQLQPGSCPVLTLTMMMMGIIMMMYLLLKLIQQMQHVWFTSSDADDDSSKNNDSIPAVQMFPVMLMMMMTAARIMIVSLLSKCFQ